MWTTVIWHHAMLLQFHLQGSQSRTCTSHINKLECQLPVNNSELWTFTLTYLVRRIVPGGVPCSVIHHSHLLTWAVRKMLGSPIIYPLECLCNAYIIIHRFLQHIFQYCISGLIHTVWRFSNEISVNLVYWRYTETVLCLGHRFQWVERVASKHFQVYCIVNY